MKGSTFFENMRKYFTLNIVPVVVLVLKSKALWCLRNQRRNSIQMMHHYPDLGSDSDWLNQFIANQMLYPDLGSDASSVWNFCTRFSHVITRGNQCWYREMLDCKTVGVFFSKGKAWRKSLTRAKRASLTRPRVSLQSRSLFSASFQTFCLTARAYLNTQKYGLFCSLRNAGRFLRLRICQNSLKHFSVSL